jgi:hypothetical protein
VFENLVAHKEPLVLTDPGLVARYQLDVFIKGLIERTREDDARAVFLVLPAASDGQGARLRTPKATCPSR